jgi:hypothetical protein
VWPKGISSSEFGVRSSEKKELKSKNSKLMQGFYRVEWLNSHTGEEEPGDGWVTFSLFSLGLF